MPKGLGYRGLVAVLAVCAIALVGASPASAERFASPTGDASDPSCPDTDPCDIETAIEHASVMAGDVITILPGDHFPTFAPLQPAANPVTIRAQPGGPRPRIVLAGSVFSLGNNDVIRGLYVECTSGVSAVTGGAVTIEQMVVHAEPPCDRGLTVSNGSVVRDSIATTNFSGTSGDAVRVADTGATLDNVTAIGLGAASDGLAVLASTQTVTVRNVIARGTDAGIRVEDDMLAADVDVNVSSSNYSSVVEAEPDADFIDGGGNQTTPPLFVNPDPLVRDFHQLTGSLTIDAGASFMGIGTLDVDGQARIQGCAPDIGGDEISKICGTTTGVPGTPSAGTPGKKTRARKCKKKPSKNSAGAAKKKCKRKKRK